MAPAGVCRVPRHGLLNVNTICAHARSGTLRDVDQGCVWDPFSHNGCFILAQASQSVDRRGGQESTHYRLAEYGARNAASPAASARSARTSSMSREGTQPIRARTMKVRDRELPCGAARSLLCWTLDPSLIHFVSMSLCSASVVEVEGTRRASAMRS